MRLHCFSHRMHGKKRRPQILIDRRTRHAWGSELSDALYRFGEDPRYRQERSVCLLKSTTALRSAKKRRCDAQRTPDLHRNEYAPAAERPEVAAPVERSRATGLRAAFQPADPNKTSVLQRRCVLAECFSPTVYTSRLREPIAAQEEAYPV